MIRHSTSHSTDEEAITVLDARATTATQVTGNARRAAQGRWAEYRRFTPLLRNLIKREVRQRYKGSLFGLLWTLVNPVILVATYAAMFHYLWRVVNIPHYAWFLFTGLAIWTFFAGGVQQAASSMVGNANLVKKVRFPREFVPLTAVAANGVTAGAMLIIAIVGCQIVNGRLHPQLVVLPYFLLCIAALTFGISLILSVLNVFFRDVEHIFAAITLPWFFLTPIFYTYETLPGLQVDRTILKVAYFINPITPFLSSIRAVVYAGTWPDAMDWAYCALVGFGVLFIGFKVFRRLEGEVAVAL